MLASGYHAKIMVWKRAFLALLLGLVLLEVGLDASTLPRLKREEHALIKVIKSHAYVRPPRVYVPTVSYVAPPPYSPIPYYNTEPYSSRRQFRSFIPHDAYY